MVATKPPQPDLDLIRSQIDLAVQEIAKFRIGLVLNPKFMSLPDFSVASLCWSSVRYGPDDFDKVPDDTRGVYAFVISQCSPVLPQHGYVVYVGIGGRLSDRSLQERYRDYLNTKKILKRDRITKMIGNWADVLHFVYAPVPHNVSPKDLIALEQEINGALLPPFSPGDRNARIKKMERMFE